MIILLPLSFVFRDDLILHYDEGLLLTQPLRGIIDLRQHCSQLLQELDQIVVAKVTEAVSEHNAVVLVDGREILHGALPDVADLGVLILQLLCVSDGIWALVHEVDEKEFVQK